MTKEEKKEMRDKMERIMELADPDTLRLVDILCDMVLTRLETR